MSLSGALNSAVSALMAQSTAIATVSDNIANANTTGYKTTHTSFESLLTGSGGTSYSSGGVTALTRSSISEQGLRTSTSSETDLAIEGSGFFTVSSSSTGDGLCYTRSGEFSVDNDGYLVNGDYYLLGWPTDTSGEVIGACTASTLKAIDTDSIASCAAATTSATVSANLPANASVGDSYTSTLEIYDSLGTASSLEITWSKTAENTWTAGFADPVLSLSSTGSAATAMTSTITLQFADTGALESTSPSPALLTISDWTTGAADSSITLDLDGMTQQSVDGTLRVDVSSIDADGMAYGSLSGISIEDGAVEAKYSNGEVRTIYRVAVATFTNPDGLEALSSGIYEASGASGASVLHLSGEGGAGTIYGSMLESSTTDTSEEFSVMIAAQQAYSAAAQVIQTASTMFETLITAVR